MLSWFLPSHSVVRSTIVTINHRQPALLLYLKLNRKSASIGTTREDLTSVSRCRRVGREGGATISEEEEMWKYDDSGIRREGSVEGERR
jgi:hypothetical protein